MFRGRYRWLMRLALVLLIGALGWMWAEREKAKHRLVVANRCGQTIGKLDIKVGDKSASYQDLSNGSDATVPFSVEPGERYDIRAEFSHGGIDHAQGVLGEEHTFIVQPGGQIVLQGRKAQ